MAWQGEFGKSRVSPFELTTGDTVRVPGLEGGEGSCGIAAEIAAPLYQL